MEVNTETLKQYLDVNIKCWRNLRDAAPTPEKRHTSDCYIDAFQSVRVSLLGELLP